MMVRARPSRSSTAIGRPLRSCDAAIVSLLGVVGVTRRLVALLRGC